MYNIPIYSLIKQIANPPPEYSVLKPDTSSDSPSEKSKGVRLLSTKINSSQQKKMGIKDKEKSLLISEIKKKFMQEPKQQTHIISKPMQTS